MLFSRHTSRRAFIAGLGSTAAIAGPSSVFAQKPVRCRGSRWLELIPTRRLLKHLIVECGLRDGIKDANRGSSIVGAAAILIERIGKAGASFRSLGDPLWDTSSSQGRLLSTLLAAIAEFERELIRERAGEGRKRAMANGVKFGRKPKLSDYQRQEAIKRRAAGETLASIAKSYAVDISMISRL